MDKQAFKQRMQNLKSYRENNPGKGYWNWKVQAYQNGGRHALGVGQVFASLADMLFNKERRTPAIAAAAYYTIHQTQNDPVLAPVEAPLVEPIADAIKSVDETPYDPGEVFLLSPENQKKQMTKNPNYRVVDTNSEEDPYGIVRRAANYHKEIHGEVPVYEYIADSDTTIKRSNLIPVGTLPLGEYTPELPHAGSYNSVLYYNASNDKLYQRAYDLNDYGPTDTKDKGASSMYIGPIRWLSRQLDKAGTPFVQRTGFVPLDEGKYYNQLPESAKKKVRERRRLRNSYEYGGEVNEFQRKTRRDIMQESLVDGRPDYNKMFQNQNEYQKDFANYWYTERAKNPKYSDQIGGDKLGSVLSNIDKATWKTPTEAMRDNMVGQGYNPTDAQINQQLNILKEKGTKGFANPKAHSYTSLRPANTWHEGVGHMVGDNTPAILNASPNVRISNSDSSYEDYVNQANEKHAQTWDFRGNNSNLKDDQGNYYIDPNRQLTPEDISNMRSRGAKIPEQWESLEDADISELTNTFAYNMYQDPVQYMANGGEVGDPDDEFIQAVNTKLGRTPDGRPIIDLEDAVNVTPIGDVLSAKDAYNAARNNDWLGVGLATATMIPFVPRAISTVLIDAYNNSPELLPKAKRTAFEDNARARMATTTESTKRHMDGGEFPKMGEYEYQYDINGVPYGTTIHEMNHNADYLKNKAIDADANSNLYYWMRSALKPFSRIDPNTDKLTKYYSKPTEQKAYMNQLREFMYANKMIDTRDQIVTPDLIKQAISKLPKGMQSIKKASEQFKSMRSYTKWFNTIPLLGVGAVGANKYFTSNENRD